MRRLLALFVAFAALPLAALALVASPARAAAPSCASSQVLLLGSYPAEVAYVLGALEQDADQPATVDGHQLWSGSIDGKRVAIAVAGQSHAEVTATATAALAHLSCVSAVVFIGTAGGEAPADLGDVAVPDRWTGDEGKTYTPVDAHALAVARQVAAEVAQHLETLAAVQDGPCPTAATAAAVTVYPIARTPRLVVGGNGVTDGDGSACSADGGMLAGCDACPPTAASPVTTVVSPLTPAEASAAATAGTLVTGVAALSPVAPPGLPGNVGNSTTAYVADDLQTTSAQAVARSHGVPFLAFRGISDTASVGDAWPAEYAIYQGLAADNAGIAARIWLRAWTPAAAAPARGTTSSAGTTPTGTASTGTTAPSPSTGTSSGELAMTGAPSALPWVALALAGTGSVALGRRARLKRR